MTTQNAPTEQIAESAGCRRCCRKLRQAAERHQREIRRTEDQLADEQHELGRWGFSLRPSEIRRAEERIAMLEVKLAALTEPDPSAGVA